MDNIKMDQRLIGWKGVDWTRVVQWRARVNTVMKLRVSQNAGNSFSTFYVEVATRNRADFPCCRLFSTVRCDDNNNSMHDKLPFHCAAIHVSNIPNAGQSSQEIEGRKLLRPLEHWDRGFESHSTNRRLSAFFLFMLSCAGSDLVMG
jgi:hypothetical protein